MPAAPWAVRRDRRTADRDPGPDVGHRGDRLRREARPRRQVTTYPAQLLRRKAMSTNPTRPAMATCEQCNAFRPVAEFIGELTRPAHAVLRVCGHVVPARAAPSGCPPQGGPLGARRLRPSALVNS